MPGRAKDYVAGHIPGAVNINGFSLATIGPDFAMGFAERVGALGIDASSGLRRRRDG